MGEKIIFIFVEGSSDEDFIKSIFNRGLEGRTVRIIKMKGNNNKKTRDKIINSLNSDFIEGLIVVDSDANNYGEWNEHVHARRLEQFLKEMRLTKYKDNVSEITKFVVIEIESWYVAGLNQSARNRLNFHKSKLDTDRFSKENLEEILGREPLIEDYSAMLEEFELDEAIKNNRSFKDFIGYIETRFGFKR